MIEEKSVIAIIRREEKFLVFHRSPARKSMPNKWQFVAGHIEGGEEPRETAEREVFEETKCGARFVAQGAQYDYYEKVNDTLWHITPLLFDYESGEVVIDAEHTEYKWATIAEIKKLDFTPMAIEQLKKFGCKT